MGRRRRVREPVRVALDRLEARHTSGLDASGTRWKVRAAPVGATVLAQPGRKSTARRIEILTPAPDQVAPRCPVFGTCGGCQLQEMPPGAQRAQRHTLGMTLAGVIDDPTVRIHPIRPAGPAFGYRNKLELSFGVRRYLDESTQKGSRAARSKRHPPTTATWDFTRQAGSPRSWTWTGARWAPLR